MFKADPTCSDGKLNQGEEKIDCGGPCAPCSKIIELEALEVRKVEWVHDFEDKYDVLISIVNPNEVYGSSKFEYGIYLNENVDVSETREDFILPGETKTVVAHGFLASEIEILKVVIDQEGAAWEKFVDYEKPNLIVTNSVYNMSAESEVGFGRATGTVMNQSGVDFETIKVKIILRDETGTLLAVNSQVMNTVRSSEQRDYLIVFPRHFSGSVGKIDQEIETNVFDSENYIRTHGQPESWVPNDQRSRRR